MNWNDFYGNTGLEKAETGMAGAGTLFGLISAVLGAKRKSDLESQYRLAVERSQNPNDPRTGYLNYTTPITQAMETAATRSVNRDRAALGYAEGAAGQGMTADALARLTQDNQWKGMNAWAQAQGPLLNAAYQRASGAGGIDGSNMFGPLSALLASRRTQAAQENARKMYLAAMQPPQQPSQVYDPRRVGIQEEEDQSMFPSPSMLRSNWYPQKAYGDGITTAEGF